MGDTKIEWADKSWNPIRGCSVVSEGCRNCYAMQVAARFSGNDPNTGKSLAYHDLAYRNESGAHWTGKVRLIEEHLEDPLRWQRPRRIFVNSMSDLFHDEVADEWILAIFAVMARAPRHVFQVLTKRPERMLSTLLGWQAQGVTLREGCGGVLPNVWLGVSVEDQKTADERIPLLLKTPAAMRWISAEPLLGLIDLVRASPDPNYFSRGWLEYNARTKPIPCPDWAYNRLDWVVVGGESGPKARPMDLAWTRSIVKQCNSARVPVFVKQLGAKPIPEESDYQSGIQPVAIERKWPEHVRMAGDRIFLDSKKGGDSEEWSPDLKVREFPETKAVTNAA